MNDHQIGRDRNGGSSADRLISAVLSAWEAQGATGASARLLGQAAGLPVSSIYYHFGDLERLSLAAQDHAREAARAWGAAQLSTFAQPGLDRRALPGLLAAVIDDWSYGERRLAFAWRECQRSALRDPRWGPPAERWRQLWDDFWAEACVQLGCEELASPTSRLFDGESYLHMLCWRRPVDRAGLDELCRGWGAWLTAAPAPPAPFREFARAQALEELESEPAAGGDETADRIAAAAAAVLARAGATGVTHRAVAAEAGLTLGAVSYRRRTSAALLRTAFEATYRQFVPRDEDLPALPARDPGAVLADLIDKTPRSHVRLGMDELILAAARAPELRPFAAQLRYLRGRSSGRYFQPLFGRKAPATPLDGAILSSFLMGLGFAQFAAATDEERRARSRAELESLMAIMA